MHKTALWFESVWQDLKYAARQLRRSPGFTAAAVVTLALGVGVNTSIFTLLNAFLLRPLPATNSSGLVAVRRGDSRPCSYADFSDFEKRVTLFSGLAADVPNESTLDLGDSSASEMVLIEGVSYNYASVLEARPSVGRWFTSDDEHGRGEPFPAVVSHRLWQSRLGADPQVLGRRVRIESQWYTVVGVAASKFRGMSPPTVTDVWVPFAQYATHNAYAARVITNRQDASAMMFGRLKPGIASSQAQAQVNFVDAQLRREYPRSGERLALLTLETPRGVAEPGTRHRVAQPVIMLAALVALVLLIACANVATLLLTRGVERRREVSIRIALGAGRARVCQQVLAESLLLSVVGAAVGLASALWANRVQERALGSLPSPIALGLDLSIDWRVLLFVLGAAIATTILFGLLPAMSLSRTELIPALKGSQSGLEAHRRRFSLRNLYAVAQVAISLMLLIVAGLFIRSLDRASRVDAGFPTRGLISARVFIPRPEFNDETGRDLYRRLLLRIRNLPGVSSATVSYASPMLTMSKWVAPDEARGGRPPVATGANIVGPDYFSTLGVSLARGRTFSTWDNASAPAVVIVNEVLAERYWPGGNAVGKTICVGRECERGAGVRAEIVGIARNAAYSSLDSAARPFLFIPIEQNFAAYVSVLIRTGDAFTSDTPQRLRQALRQVDDRLRVYEIGTIDDQMAQSLWQLRWEASVLGAFGALALLVAVVGVYAVFSFSAGQRVREFGIRIALGAAGRDVLWLVIGDGLALGLAGVSIGLVCSVACTWLLRGFLYGLSPTDETTFGLVIVVWFAIIVVASCVPAYRSTRVDPAASLRCE